MLEQNRTHMRRVSIGLAVLAFATVSSMACRQDAPVSAQTAPERQVAARTVSVPVDGMICVVCAGQVKSALKAVPGVQDAEINLEKRNATIRFEDGTVSVEQLTRAINGLGYKTGVPAELR